MTTFKYQLTPPMRELLAQALDFAVQHWPADTQAGARRDTAQWLRGLSGSQLGIADPQVRDLASCLAYAAACEQDDAKRQQQHELLLKLVSPLGKTQADVDRVLEAAKAFFDKERP